MKIIFISDIHGMVDNLSKIDLNCDKIAILGDVFGYSMVNNKILVNFMKQYQDKIILIKGNCDSKQVFTELGLNFYELYNIDLANHKFCFLHGHNLHLADEETDVVVFGHKHYPFIEKKDNKIYICVGSLSDPRNNSKCSYAIYNNGYLKIIDLEQNVIEELAL